MKNLMILSLLALMALGFNSNDAQANQRHRGGKGMMPQKMMKELELSEEQKTKIEKMRESKREAMKSLRTQRKAMREKLDSALKSDASEGELRKLHGEMKKVRSEMQDKRFDSMLEIRKVLTKEQRKKFHESMSKQRGKRRRGRHM